MTAAFQVRPDGHVFAGQEDLGLQLPGVLRRPNKNLFSLAVDPQLTVGRHVIGYYAGGGIEPISVNIAPEQYQKFITSTSLGEWGIRSRWGQYDSAKTFLETALTANLEPADAAAKTKVQNELAEMRKFRIFGGGSKGKVLCFLARLVGDAHLPPAAARDVLAILAKPENRKDYRQLAGTNSDYVALLAALRRIPAEVLEAELQMLIKSDNDGSRGIGLLQGAVLKIIQERRVAVPAPPPPATLNAPPPPRLPPGAPQPDQHHTPTEGQPPPAATPNAPPPPRPPPAAVLQPRLVPPPPPPPMPPAEFGRQFMEISRPFMERDGVHPRARAGFEIIRSSFETPAPALPTDPEIQARMREELAIFWSRVIATSTREQNHIGLLRSLFQERVAEPQSPLFTFVRANAFKIDDTYHYSQEDMAVLGHLYQEKLESIPGHIPTYFQPPICIEPARSFDQLAHMRRIKSDIENALRPNNPLKTAQQLARAGEVYQLAFPVLRSEHWVGVLLRVTRGATPEEYTCQFEILSSTIHRADDPDNANRIGIDLARILPELAEVLNINAPPASQPRLLHNIQPPRYQQPYGTDSDCGPCVLANFFHSGLPSAQAEPYDQGSADQMLTAGKQNILRYRQIEMVCRSQPIPTSFTGRFLQQNEHLDIAGDAVLRVVPDFQRPQEEPAGNPFPALEALERWQLEHPLPPLLPPPPPPPAVIVAPPEDAPHPATPSAPPPPAPAPLPPPPPPPAPPAGDPPPRPPTPPTNPEGGTTPVSTGKDPLSQEGQGGDSH